MYVRARLLHPQRVPRGLDTSGQKWVSLLLKIRNLQLHILGFAPLGRQRFLGLHQLRVRQAVAVLDLCERGARRLQLLWFHSVYAVSTQLSARAHEATVVPQCVSSEYTGVCTRA